MKHFFSYLSGKFSKNLIRFKVLFSENPMLEMETEFFKKCNIGKHIFCHSSRDATQKIEIFLNHLRMQLKENSEKNSLFLI